MKAGTDSTSVGLLDRLAAWRDRLLANERFQRWAAAFPLTRPLARRRARKLFDLCAGFVYTQVLLACVELDLFRLLADGPQRADELAARLNLSPEAARRLLEAGVALELVRHDRDDRFGLGPLGAALLGNPGIPAMVRHHRMLYADLADPVGLLRGEASETALSEYWSYAARAEPADAGGDSVAGYSELMSASQPFVANQVLACYSFKGHKRLLDVGGGQGTFLTAIGERCPHLDLMLFDLPAVAERARVRFADTALAGRVSVTGGDFLRDPLPRGADVATLVRIVHDHDDAVAARILAAVYEALEPGGTLVVAEPMARTRGAEPVGGAYFGFYLLAMRSGRPRSPKELAALLRDAGFARPKLLRTPMPLLTRVMVATRPA